MGDLLLKHFSWHGGEEVTRRSAKPPCEGSSPSRASTLNINSARVGRMRVNRGFGGRKSARGRHPQQFFVEAVLRI